MRRFFVLPLAFLSVLLPCQALAVGVGTSPHELDFNIRSWSSTTETLYVVNAGDTEAKYKIYVDEEYEGWFDIVPDEFSLAPQAYKDVKVTVSPPLLASGTYAAYIYVVVANSPSKLGVSTGIKVPVNIYISNLPLLIAISIAAALAVALIIFLLGRRRMTGRRKMTGSEAK